MSKPVFNHSVAQTGLNLQPSCLSFLSSNDYGPRPQGTAKRGGVPFYSLKYWIAYTRTHPMPASRTYSWGEQQILQKYLGEAKIFYQGLGQVGTSGPGILSPHNQKSIDARMSPLRSTSTDLLCVSLHVCQLLSGLYIYIYEVCVISAPTMLLPPEPLGPGTTVCPSRGSCASRML